MKLRELFDKMTPGMLDTHVSVKIEYLVTTEKLEIVRSSTFRPLKAVEIQDDGSVTLVVEE